MKSENHLYSVRIIILIVLLTIIQGTYCKALTLVPNHESDPMNYRFEDKNTNVTKLGVDSITIRLKGGGYDLLAKFKSDTNYVECKSRPIGFEEFSQFSTREHNILLGLIDSLFISRSSKIVEKEIIIPDIEISIDGALLEVSIYNNGEKNNEYVNPMCFRGITAYLFSDQFFRLIHMLYNYYDKILTGKTDDITYNSAKENLIHFVGSLMGGIDKIPNGIIMRLKEL